MMPDREKVQHGLECCYNNNCGACPYSAIKKCQHKLHSDALVLLKEQEPRIITLEEAEQAADGVWTELYVPRKLSWLLIFSRVSRGGGPFMDLVEADGQSWYRFREDYNKNIINFEGHSRWRCWSVRPTEEQRKAVPWDE